MTDQQQVVVVRGAINSVDALCVVASLTNDIEATVESEMIYPYYCFDADCSIPTVIGRKQVAMICLVDAVNGIGATADSFELKKEAVATELLLNTEFDETEAARIAHRTVTHRLGKKLRTITTFDATVTPRGLIHKRFWIVRTSDARVMVDSTTGNLHPLKLRAA